MKKEVTNVGKYLRRVYQPPKVEVIFLEMEQGIAAGSAAINPSNQTGDILDEWDTGTDRNTDLNW
ncbi:hypothetical protein D3C87_1213910 [compost metagenome]